MGLPAAGGRRSAQTLTGAYLPRESRLEILTLVVSGSSARRSALATASSSVDALQRDTRTWAWPAKCQRSTANGLFSVMRT